MFIVDIIILGILALGFIMGFKHGFIREVVSLVGIILVMCLSFVLKNPISIFMYKHLPFFEFNFLIKGAGVLNILLYEIIAFLIVFSLLMIVLKIVISVSNIFEKILKMTIILSIPSKILGGIFGIVKNYVIVFLILYIISLPIFSLNIGKTKIGNFMLTNTPIASSIVSDTVKVFYEFSDLVDEYKKEDNSDKFNQEALDILIKYNAITKENAKSLIESGKLRGLKVN